MTPYYQDDAVTIYHGDCREILPEIGKVDAVVTDPPSIIVPEETDTTQIGLVGIDHWRDRCHELENDMANLRSDVCRLMREAQEEERDLIIDYIESVAECLKQHDPNVSICAQRFRTLAVSISNGQHKFKAQVNNVTPPPNPVQKND